jgi:tetrahydromethanopterin S-methyltransferase subunit G
MGVIMEYEKPTMVTNQDLYERMNELENKVDIICAKMEQATGAWTFIKILCSVAFGIAVIWNSISTYMKP